MNHSKKKRSSSRSTKNRRRETRRIYLPVGHSQELAALTQHGTVGFRGFGSGYIADGGTKGVRAFDELRYHVVHYRPGTTNMNFAFNP